jgi:hypothetical protein
MDKKERGSTVTCFLLEVPNKTPKTWHYIYVCFAFVKGVGGGGGCSPAVEEPLHQVSIFLHFSCKCLILMLLIQGFRFYFFCHV